MLLVGIQHLRILSLGVPPELLRVLLRADQNSELNRATEEIACKFLFDADADSDTGKNGLFTSMQRRFLSPLEAHPRPRYLKSHGRRI